LPKGGEEVEPGNMVRALGLIVGLGLLIGCGAATTSRENAAFMTVLDDITDYDNPPTLVRAVKPVYPEMAREVGAEGRVILKALVLEDGTLGGVQILESPNPILADHAITALRKSVFAPAMRQGKPVKATITIPFVFDREETKLQRWIGTDRDKSGTRGETLPIEPPTLPEDQLEPTK
jgi:TonB family protein